jgi:hypothetical protein
MPTPMVILITLSSFNVFFDSFSSHPILFYT